MFEAFWIGSLIILSTFKRVVDFASRPARKESSVSSIGIRERKEKEKLQQEEMMILRRRLACCTRDREISLDFDKQESKIYLLFSVVFLAGNTSTSSA